MNTGPTSETNGRPSGPRIVYAGDASVADVMFDQLGYLLAHAAQPCPPECADCARLGQVRNWLLLPFGRRNPRPSG
jgi:hypothetical protein